MNSNINEGIKCGKNCTILTRNKQDALVRKNTSEAASTSKDSNIRVTDKTSSQVGKNLVDFEAIKRDLLSGENSSKISNNPPVVCTNISVVQKHYDVNTSGGTRLSSTQDMKFLEILEELQNSNKFSVLNLHVMM